MDVAAIAPVFVHASDKRRKNIWYSIGSGNWTDPNIWMSNALSIRSNYNYPGQRAAAPIFPEVGDDVFINHSVTVNVTTIVNNLYVSGSLLFDATVRNLTINGDLQAVGTVNLTGNNHNLILLGVNNYVANFISGTQSNVYYARNGDQSIMPVSHRNVLFQGIGTKSIKSGYTITGNMQVNNGYVLLESDLLTSGTLICFGGTLDLSSYNSTITGATTCTAGSSIIKGSSTGLVKWIGRYTGTSCTYNLTGNPDVEYRNGWTLNSMTLFYTGTGNWNCTTNNQTIILSGPNVNYNCNINVVGAVTVTLNASSTSPYSSAHVFYGVLNGTVAGSTFMHAGTLTFGNSTLPMAIGVFNHTSNANFIGYSFAGNFALPYTNYSSLYVEGSGIKSLSGNTIIADKIELGGSVTELDAAGYTLSVGGVLTNRKLFKQSGSGSLVFTGNVTIPAGTNGKISFIGNPNVEFKNGVTGLGIAADFVSGTGAFTFSTNNQAWAGGTSDHFATWLISGAITVQYSGGILNLSAGLNGNNAASKFDNRGILLIQFASEPMSTGILEANIVANTVKYSMNSNQDVKGGTYRTLEFTGSGVKTLQGNVIVNTTAGGSWSITGAATINYNGFTITTI